MNNIQLMGRLTANPVLKATTTGTSVCSFSIAVDRRYSKSDEKQTDFIDCVAWQKKAEILTKHFKKGDRIAVDGTLQTRVYVDTNGNNRKATEVIIDNLYFCENKKKAETAETVQPTEIIIDDEDLPF